MTDKASFAPSAGPALADWFERAEGHKQAADVLRAQINALWKEGGETQRPLLQALLESYRLLLAYSLENMAKGYALKRYYERHGSLPPQSFASQKKEVWGVKDGHNSLGILRFCDFPLSAAEQEFLARMRNYTKIRGVEPKASAPATPDMIRRGLKSLDEALFLGLRERLRAALNPMP